MSLESLRTVCNQSDLSCRSDGGEYLSHKALASLVFNGNTQYDRIDRDGNPVKFNQTALDFYKSDIDEYNRLKEELLPLVLRHEPYKDLMEKELDFVEYHRAFKDHWVNTCQKIAREYGANDQRSPLAYEESWGREEVEEMDIIYGVGKGVYRWSSIFYEQPDRYILRNWATMITMTQMLRDEILESCMGDLEDETIGDLCTELRDCRSRNKELQNDR